MPTPPLQLNDDEMTVLLEFVLAAQRETSIATEPRHLTPRQAAR
jgi:hypothetical protein